MLPRNMISRHISRDRVTVSIRGKPLLPASRRQFAEPRPSRDSKLELVVPGLVHRRSQRNNHQHIGLRRPPGHPSRTSHPRGIQ